MTLDPALEIALGLGLALLWLRAASHKLRAPGAFRDALADYRLLPPRALTPVAAGLVAVELGLGLGLALGPRVPGLRAGALLGTAALLSLYGGAIGLNLLRGRRYIDCGCAGPAQRQPLDEWLLWRNALLVALALGGLLPVSTRPLLWLDVVTVAGVLAASAALWSALHRLHASAALAAPSGR